MSLRAWTLSQSQIFRLLWKRIPWKQSSRSQLDQMRSGCCLCSLYRLPEVPSNSTENIAISNLKHHWHGAVTIYIQQIWIAICWRIKRSHLMRTSFDIKDKIVNIPFLNSTKRTQAMKSKPCIITERNDPNLYDSFQITRMYTGFFSHSKTVGIFPHFAIWQVLNFPQKDISSYCGPQKKNRGIDLVIADDTFKKWNKTALEFERWPEVGSWVHPNRIRLS